MFLFIDFSVARVFFSILETAVPGDATDCPFGIPSSAPRSPNLPIPGTETPLPERSAEVVLLLRIVSFFPTAI